MSGYMNSNRSWNRLGKDRQFEAAFFLSIYSAYLLFYLGT